MKQLIAEVQVHQARLQREQSPAARHQYSESVSALGAYRKAESVVNETIQTVLSVEGLDMVRIGDILEHVVENSDKLDENFFSQFDQDTQTVLNYTAEKICEATDSLVIAARKTNLPIFETFVAEGVEQLNEFRGFGFGARHVFGGGPHLNIGLNIGGGVNPAPAYSGYQAGAAHLQDFAPAAHPAYVPGSEVHMVPGVSHAAAHHAAVAAGHHTAHAAGAAAGKLGILGHLGAAGTHLGAAGKLGALAVMHHPAILAGAAAGYGLAKLHSYLKRNDPNQKGSAWQGAKAVAKRVVGAFRTPTGSVPPVATPSAQPEQQATASPFVPRQPHAPAQPNPVRTMSRGPEARSDFHNANEVGLGAHRGAVSSGAVEGSLSDTARAALTHQSPHVSDGVSGMKASRGERVDTSGMEGMTASRAPASATFMGGSEGDSQSRKFQSLRQRMYSKAAPADYSHGPALTHQQHVSSKPETFVATGQQPTVHGSHEQEPGMGMVPAGERVGAAADRTSAFAPHAKALEGRQGVKLTKAGNVSLGTFGNNNPQHPGAVSAERATRTKKDNPDVAVEKAGFASGSVSDAKAAKVAPKSAAETVKKAAGKAKAKAAAPKSDYEDLMSGFDPHIIASARARGSSYVPMYATPSFGGRLNR